MMHQKISDTVIIVCDAIFFKTNFALSNLFATIFEKLSIHIINVGGKDTIEKYVPILEAYSIPHVASTFSGNKTCLTKGSIK
jgi:hypothetical protein